MILEALKWVMVVGGALTLSMAYAVVAPTAALKSTFGESLAGPLAGVIVRNWAALICLSALFVIWAAFVPAWRVPALAIAIIGKFYFVALVVAQPTLRRKAAVVVVSDLILTLLYGAGLVTILMGQDAPRT